MINSFKRLCDYCGEELSSDEFSYCPHCGISLTKKEYTVEGVDLILKDISDSSPHIAKTVTTESTNFAFRNMTKISGNAKNALLRLANNSDSALGVLKDVVDNFDDMPVDFRNELLAKISKGSKDPRLAKVANALITSSPTIAEIAVGFTPLSPYSKVIGKFVENMVHRQKRDKKMNHTLDLFLRNNFSSK
ncbi:MAG TPA: hypothetical protein VFY68_06985 [Nitrososphaeraceae archaeon]|nr:hypothetical protein [Nitrososphaeraceae archaeon]